MVHVCEPLAFSLLSNPILPPVLAEAPDQTNLITVSLRTPDVIPDDLFRLPITAQYRYRYMYLHAHG